MLRLDHGYHLAYCADESQQYLRVAPWLGHGSRLACFDGPCHYRGHGFYAGEVRRCDPLPYLRSGRATVCDPFLLGSGHRLGGLWNGHVDESPGPGRDFDDLVDSESDFVVSHLGRSLDGPDRGSGLDPFSHRLCVVSLKVADFLLELVSVSL